MGTTSSTVVRLSRKAENTAVTTDSTIKMPMGLAFTFLADQMATNSKTPDTLVMATMIIMPVKSAMVLKSMPAKACFWLMTPVTMTRPPPNSATTVRFTFSLSSTA